MYRPDYCLKPFKLVLPTAGMRILFPPFSVTDRIDTISNQNKYSWYIYGMGWRLSRPPPKKN